jgi:hypothetical protein
MQEALGKYNLLGPAGLRQLQIKRQDKSEPNPPARKRMLSPVEVSSEALKF